MSEPRELRAGDGYAWYVLAVLFLVYVMNFVDRNIFAIVLDDIKGELGASDTLMGLLAGTAFTLFYTAAGIPIARLADRRSRRAVIAVGVTLWSAMTAASGLAQNVVQMALARIGVGVGEAAGTPPSHSLISDYFPPEKRATALSIYSWGIYVGVMFGFMGGGYIKEAFDWRMAFLLAGLPGIPLALLVYFTVREPPRGLSEAVQVSDETPAAAEVIRFLWSRRAFVYMTIGGCFLSLAGYSILTWVPTFFGRVHGMGGSEIGLWVGLVAGLGGAAGAFFGGALTDRLRASDQRWYVWLPAIVSVAAVPLAFPFYLSEDRTTALLCFAPFYAVQNMYVGPMWSVAQSVVRVRMRALTSALLLVVLNLAGLGVGPPVVGFLNDRLAVSYGDEAIRYSLLGMSALGALAAPFFLLAARTLREELEEATG